MALAREAAKQGMGQTNPTGPAPAMLPGPPGPVYSLPAWRPFRDPLPVAVGDYWFVFLLPTALLIAVTYKAVRMHRMRGYVRAVVVMTIQIVLGMLALAGFSYFLVEMYARWMGA